MPASGACSTFEGALANYDLASSLPNSNAVGPAADAESCCTACLNDNTGCTGFVLFQGWCYLKSGTLTLVTLEGRNSYMMFAPPPPELPPLPPALPPPTVLEIGWREETIYIIYMGQVSTEPSKCTTFIKPSRAPLLVYCLFVGIEHDSSRDR